MNENLKGSVKGGVENSNNSKKTERGGGDDRRKAKLLWLFFLIMVVLIISTAVAGSLLGQESDLKRVNLSYVSLALLGVLFHLANQYRVRRDEEGFDWNEYQFDYYFRALQACIYVIVIDFMASKDSTGLTGEMTLISLFVGMYIRRVEEAFETLGDRFGDMIKGILGSTVKRLTPEEHKKKLTELGGQWATLNKSYLALKSKIGEPERKDVEGMFSRTQDLILKNKVEAAERELFNLDFKIKDLELSGS
jgi:hypothetical protein